MNFFDNILNFITDSEKRLSARATVFILALFGLITLDNIIGFSYYYNKQKQLEQLKSITELLSDTTLTSETKSNLISLQSQLFDRKNIIDHSSSFIRDIISTTSNSNQKSINKYTGPIRNNIWFLFSSSGVYILTTFIIVPIIILTDRKTPFLKLLASMLIFIIIMLFSSWFNFWLFDKLIPDRVFGSWAWNYIINFILQIGLIIGYTFSSNTINKTKK